MMTAGQIAMRCEQGEWRTVYVGNDEESYGIEGQLFFFSGRVQIIGDDPDQPGKKKSVHIRFKNILAIV